jgi:hypothetical protein
MHLALNYNAFSRLHADALALIRFENTPLTVHPGD